MWRVTVLVLLATDVAEGSRWIEGVVVLVGPPSFVPGRYPHESVYVVGGPLSGNGEAVVVVLGFSKDDFEIVAVGEGIGGGVGQGLWRIEQQHSTVARNRVIDRDSGIDAFHELVAVHGIHADKKATHGKGKRKRLLLLWRCWTGESCRCTRRWRRCRFDRVSSQKQATLKEDCRRDEMGQAEHGLYPRGLAAGGHGGGDVGQHLRLAGGEQNTMPW